MIKFFRTIRQRMLSENKFNRYVIYALGEIFLVMIGILLALQVNNWNQNRIVRIEEETILNSLREDFQGAIKEFQTLNTDRENMLSAAKILYEIKQEEIAQYPTTYLDSVMFITMNAPTFNNQAGSINALLSSGKINLISNQEIKKKIIQWPGDVADMTEDEMNQSNLYYNMYIPTAGKYLSWNDVFRSASYRSTRFNSELKFSMEDNVNVTNDYKSLLRDKSFLNQLKVRTVFFELSMDESNNLIKKASDIITLIDEGT